MAPMKVKRINRLIGCMSMVLTLGWQPCIAAEIRGSVSIDYHGLFESEASAQVHPVSVALLPKQNQRTVNRGVRSHRIEIVKNRMRPAFLTVQKGDRIEFVNRDAVFHELFSLSPGDSVNEQLGKANSGGKTRAKFTLGQEGTTHFFCRIHNKSYARIDVVDTPYLQMVEPGGRFHFVGLAAGAWKLRMASPAAETRWVDVTAMTTPPPLELKLMSRGGGSASVASQVPQNRIGELYKPHNSMENNR